MKTYEVQDEDGEIVGEVRRIHDAEVGWMWRAIAIRHGDWTGFRENRLGLHDISDDAEAEIRKYWGMIQ